MNPIFLRSAKVMTFPIAAIALVLLAEFVFSIGMVPASYLPSNELLPGELGTVAAPIDTEPYGDSAIRWMWPVEQNGSTTAVVVVAWAPGYRSRIEVAVSVAADGEVLAEHVLAQSESAYARRALENAEPDGLSGATFTAEGVRLATDAAVAAGREYFEEQQ